MCFSAEADFVSGAVVGAVGVATLAEVDDRRALPLAALPLAFAAHQLAEGVVWLGLEGKTSKPVFDAALQAYLLFAWVLLPIFIPFAIRLVEPVAWRRRSIGVLLVVGTIVGGYLFWSITSEAVTAHIDQHTIVYGGAGTHGGAFTLLYVIATCGAFLLSSHRRIVWFGVANLAAVALLAWYQSSALTSLWCLWAALASVLVYLHFASLRRERATVRSTSRRDRTPAG
jgi:hypothetical protein